MAEAVSTQITTMDELKNTIVLGLDLWVLSYHGGTVEIWKLNSPRIIQGARGPKLGSPVIKEDYVNRWGIKDGDCHHTVHLVGHKCMQLFNSAGDAQTAARR
jgi:hypothetical protein